MEGLNTRNSSTTADSERQVSAGEHRTRALIIGGYPRVRQGLIPLIKRESDLMVCAEAGNACEALATIGKEQVDFAIIDIYKDDMSKVRVIEEIRLLCPQLPVLILSLANASRSAEAVLNPEAGEKVMRAIQYIQSLLSSRIAGFTVLVDL
ncbi:MAG: response regulator [Planctomycetota bacterium]|jgi:DNA-binding NarL/FixJ family response regulator